MNHTVCFKDVHVREYERTISDNPSVSSGAPVGIGWKHGQSRSVPLEVFEAKRQMRSDLVLTKQEREEILIEWGATFQEILGAIRTTVKAKNQRRQSVTTIKYDRLEETFETVSQGIKRLLKLRNFKGKSESRKLVKCDVLPATRTSVEQLKMVYSECNQEAATSNDTSSSTTEAHQLMDQNQKDNSDLQKVISVHSANKEQDEESAPHIEEIIVNHADKVFDDDVSVFTTENSVYSYDALERWNHRDSLFWQLQAGHQDGPKIQRVFSPVVIVEDGDSYIDRLMSPQMHTRAY